MRDLKSKTLAFRCDECKVYIDHTLYKKEKIEETEEGYTIKETFVCSNCGHKPELYS